MVGLHPITAESFAIIDREIGDHSFSLAEYAIARRVIHSTADFEFKHLLRFSEGAIEGAIAALRQGVPIVTDVNMVQQGIASTVARSFQNPITSAVAQVTEALPGKTRTETGLLQCWQQTPEAIFLIGNAPTALLALCDSIRKAQANNQTTPALVVGVPVGFVSVVEAKAALAATDVPQIRAEGRKGGSPVAAAILNALIALTQEERG